jgi:hypothetical protein
MATIPAKVAGQSTWVIFLALLLVTYVGYRNYDQNGSVFNFTP